MNSAERVRATLAGETVDRRAFAPILSLYGARLSGCPLDSYYTKAADYARGQALVRERFAPDVLFAPFAFALIGVAYGSEIRWYADQAPNMVRPAIASAREWDELAQPDPDNHPVLLFLRECTRLLVMDHDGEVPIAAVLPAPTDLPELVMGLDAWMGTVLFDTERARHIVEQTVDVFVRLANTLFADGATMLTVSCPLATPAVATREMVVSFTLPALEAAFAQLQGPVILANAGSPMVAHLDLLRGLPATVAFFVDETDDLGQARALLGRDATLMGGLDCSSMARRSAPELEKTCRAILANRRDDARYILSHSGTDVPWSTAPECIDVLRKVAESYKGGASCV